MGRLSPIKVPLELELFLITPKQLNRSFCNFYADSACPKKELLVMILIIFYIQKKIKIFKGLIFNVPDHILFTKNSEFFYMQLGGGLHSMNVCS